MRKEIASASAQTWTDWKLSIFHTSIRPVLPPDAKGIPLTLKYTATPYDLEFITPLFTGKSPYHTQKTEWNKIQEIAASMASFITSY